MARPFRFLRIVAWENYFLFIQVDGAPEAMGIGGVVRARMVERGGQLVEPIRALPD